MGNRDEQIRNQQREQWTAASAGWINRRAEVSSPTRLITEHMIALSGISPGFHVLDLACGVGDPAFTLAEMVGEEGRVLGLDLADAMVEGARSWATKHEVNNTEFRAIQNELELGVHNESFDLCTCRHGLMFMPDPGLALHAMAIAAKKGGRITISTWGLPQNSPAFTLLGQVIDRHAQVPAPESNAPGLFAMPTPEMHKRLFESIGFRNIEVHLFDCSVLTADNPEDMWEKITVMGGPMVKLIADLQSSVGERIQKDFIYTLYEMFAEDRVVLKAEAIVTTGTKPY